MSEVQDHEAIEPPAGDAMVARLDQILDDFASAVADTSIVSDAVRIDRITRLEKPHAQVHGGAAGRRVGAVRAIPGGRAAGRQCAPGADWSRHRGTNRAGVPHLTGQRSTPAEYRAGVVV